MEGNDTARAFANIAEKEDVISIYEEEKEESHPHIEETKFEGAHPKVIQFEEPIHVKPEGGNLTCVNRRRDVLNLPPRRRQGRVARKPSNIHQLMKEEMPKESSAKWKSTDLHIESSYNSDPDLEDVDNVWSGALFLCNIYNFFTFFFFLGIEDSPRGTWLLIEVITEILLLADAIILILLVVKRPHLLNYMPLSRTQNESTQTPQVLPIVFRCLSSFPQFSILLLSRVSIQTLESFPMAFIRVLKLLRYSDIWSYLGKKLRIVRGMYAIYVKGAQYILSIFILVHIVTMLWLTLIRLEDDENAWKYKFGYNKASLFEYYCLSLFYTVSNMGGMCYGENYPITIIERFVYCVIVFIGNTSLAALFGSLANSIYISNARAIQNNKKLEQIKLYSSTRNLPEEIKQKLIDYFSLIHLEFAKYEEQYALLQELPSCLRTELSLYINLDFIQKVKLFQLSDSSFIIALMTVLKPMICLNGDYIVRKGEIANSMYLIKAGLVKALCADDENVVIAYMGEGCYFGEIGLLLEGKRSVSVKAHTNCLLFVMEKKQLFNLLDKFRYHRIFLESVGKQRLHTTYVSDIQQEEIQLNSQDITNATALVEAQGASPRGDVKMKGRYIIEKNSSIHLYGSIILGTAIIWSNMYMAFLFAFNDKVDFRDYPLLITLDMITFIILILDIPFKYHLVTPSVTTLYSVTQTTEYFRIDIYLVLDILCSIPFDYLLWAVGSPVSWLRFLLLAKIYRLKDVYDVIGFQFKRFHLFNIVMLSIAYFLSSHVVACLIYKIGLIEYERGGRFDGKSLFTSVEQTYASFKQIQEADLGERYVHCIYLACCIMGSNIYGDILPLTSIEELFVCAISLLAKLFLAVFFAEVSNFISSFHSSYIEHVSKTHQIINWLKMNNVNSSLIGRIVNYRNVLWRKFQGIEETSLLYSMPETLRYKIKYAILEKLVQIADVIPKDDYGATVTIIKNLYIRVYPKGEFIIKEGEIASEMFFIIDGLVDIYSKQGVKLSRLTEGKCFGEMALLKEDAKIRNASAYCVSDVSIAILNESDFVTICDNYPLFKEKIFGVVKEREQQNLFRTGISVRASPNQKLNESRDRGPEKSNFVQEITNKKSLNFSMEIESKMSFASEIREYTDDASISKTKFVLIVLRATAALYNILFIPLQVAFRVEINPYLYTVESLILLLHLFDIFIQIRKYYKYSTITKNESDEEESSEDSQINEEVAVTKKSKALIWILLETSTVLPWYIILQNIYHPIFVIAIIKFVKLFKIWPLVKLMSLLKKIWVNIIRIFEVIFYYYLIVHVMGCLFILMMYVADTKNESWVKRVPFPKREIEGYRIGDNMEGVSTGDIYLAAVYFMYCTMSHISIGDIAAVNVQERIMATIYVALTLHFYVLLFANITSMITDLAKGLQATLQNRYESLVTSIKSDSLPRSLAIKIKDYFDFLWVDSKGIDEGFIEELPGNIRGDIYMILFKTALESSFLFKGQSGEFEKCLAVSLLKFAKIKRFMKGDIIIKAGSLNSKTLLLLEGELALIGIPHSRVGLMKPGLFYSTMNPDIISTRHPAHLVAAMTSTVAAMNENDMKLLLKAFPMMNNRFFFSNSNIMSRCCDTLDEYMELIGSQKPSEHILEEEFTFADEIKYGLVLEEALKPEDPFTVKLNKAVEATFELILENQGETGSTGIAPICKLKRSKRVTVNDVMEDDRIFLEPKMKYYFVIYIVHLANILFTIISLPLEIAFPESVGPGLITFEAIFLLESAMHIIMRMRTAVVMRGQMCSHNYSDIFQVYWDNGFLFDIFGVLPFNFIFLLSGTENPWYVIVPLRLLRVIMAGNSTLLTGHLQLLNYRFSSLIHIMTILTTYFLLWHWTSSIWYFLCEYIEEGESLTWGTVNQLNGTSMTNRYIYSIFFTIKMVTGVGSSDSYPATNLERIVSCLFVHIGDVLFAVIFGLIAAFTSSLSSDMEEYLIQRKKIDQFAETFKLTKQHQEKLEEYYSFLRSLRYDPAVYQKVKDQVPISLAKEIAYETNKHIIFPLFKDYNSLNFCMKLAYSIDVVHYAPGDSIVNKGSYGEEMYFIMEGRVAFIAADKHTVIQRKSKGESFGEAGIFVTMKHEYYVRAELYSCIYILRRDLIEKLRKKFCSLNEKIESTSEEYKRNIILNTSLNSDSEEEVKVNIITTLQGMRRHNSETMLREQMEGYTKRKLIFKKRRKKSSRLNVFDGIKKIGPNHFQKESTPKPHRSYRCFILSFITVHSNWIPVLGEMANCFPTVNLLSLR